MALSTGARLGPYEILSALGAGGMGEVYRAVAIKVLPADLATDAKRLTRFTRRAKATAALSHPNMIGVHDVGPHEGVPCLAEELLDGEFLRQRLAHRAIPAPEALTRLAASDARKSKVVQLRYFGGPTEEGTAAPFDDSRASASRSVVMKARRL
jgi:serine/threonine protein kinase